jgi:thiamine pyrophosphate-dependent acetolactate synthase large subunit-like protein
MKVYERLAQAFKAEGMTHLFGMMGDGNMYWMEALDKLGGIKQLEVRHEGVGLGMADGWARHTHTTGVCTATCGPGVTQLATAFVTAARAQSPIVAFCGEYPRRDQDYVQRYDQAPFAAACEAGFIRVETPEYADEAVRKAFYLAKLESRPIMLSAPMDVQQAKFEDDDPYVPSSTLFPSSRLVRPDEEALNEAVEIIAKAKKPVIVAGRGAIWSGAGDSIQSLGKRIGALISTSLRAKNWMADKEYHAGISGLYATKTAIEMFHEADVVIGVGASLNRYTTEHGYLYPNAKYIHLDPKPHVVMGMGRSADVYLQTDARVGVEAIEAALAKRSVKNTGYRTGEVLERLANQYEDRTEFDIGPGEMDPRALCRALDETVPQNIGVLTGSGASSGFAMMNFTRARPFIHSAQFFGCIGQMLPAAMGIIQATGGKPLMLVEGDASTMMHLSDFDTAVRYKMPLLIVVQNDQALGSEYQKMVAHKMDAELSTIPTPDIGGLARAFGGKGTLAKSVEEARAAAAEWVKNPCPMIIDARISRNAITLAHRRTLYGKDE